MLWWITQNIIIVALLAAIVSLICRIKHFSPATRHALWLVVLVKLVTPPLFLWPWNIPVSHELLTETISTKPTLPQQIQVQINEPSLTSDDDNLNSADPQNLIVSSETFVIPLNSESTQTNSATAPPVTPEIPFRAQLENTTTHSIAQWLFWIGAVWISGIVLMFFWQYLRIRQMDRLVKSGEDAPDWLNQLVAETAALMPVRAPRACIVKSISTPLLWAWGEPLLLWPEKLSEQLTPEAKQGVVLHELAHLKRKDHWVGRLELFAGCLWWPNPLFWYVRHQIRENSELACDAWVTQTLPHGRRDYADALLTVCENYTNPAVPLPALGMGKSTRRTLERRLTMILRDRVPFRLSASGIVALLLLSLLTLPGWSQSKNDKPQLPEAQSAEPVAEEIPNEVEIVEGTVVESTVPAQKEPQGNYELIEPDAVVEPVQKNGKRTDSAPPQVEVGIAEYTDDYNDEALDIVITNPAAANNRKLQQLEKKFDALLQEIRALKKAKSSGQPNKLQSELKKLDEQKLRFSQESLLTPSTDAPAVSKPTKRSAILSELGYTVRGLSKDSNKKNAEVVESKTLTLVRTTYRISRVDAKSLETFLKKVVQADVLQIQIAGRETEFDGNYADEIALTQPDNEVRFLSQQTITVTTTPETQQFIGQLIALIENAPRKKSGTNFGLFLNENSKKRENHPVDESSADFEAEAAATYETPRTR